MSLSVLQVASGCPGWGGVELHILNLSSLLQQRGYDVTIACRPGRWVEEKAHLMGLSTVPIVVKNQSDWHDFFKMRRVLREKKIDVVHVHWSSDVIMPGIAALCEKTPVRIMSRHMPYPLKSYLGAKLYSHLYTKIVPVSASVSQTLLHSGIPLNKIEVIHHGTDVDAFAGTTLSRAEVRGSLGIPDDYVTLGIIGRIAPEKGHLVLLEALRKLRDRYPLRLVIVGNGPDELAIREKVQSLGLESEVLFTGFRDDVNNVIAALDIVVVPSTWNEPCSAVVQQAMALSKPVVATLVGGTPEMVLEGETGLLVPPSNSDALADALASLAGDAFLRKRLGQAGLLRVEALFSLQVMTDKIEALYHREYERVCGAKVMKRVGIS